MTSSQPVTEVSREDPVHRISPVAWGVALAVIVLLGFAFRVPLGWMYERWIGAESYYSHGFLVPIVAVYLIWRDRYALAALPRGRSLFGLALLVLGLMIYLLSGMMVVFFTAVFGLILMLWGMTGFIFGLPVMKRTAFAAFLLTFMVPLPLATIAGISLKLKLFAAEVAMRMIELSGIVALREGSTIYLGDAVVTVGNACSGLRSLISLIFLGVLFAYISNLTWPRKLLLFLASFPIAIIANIVRVFILCMVAYNGGNEAITPLVHDASGYLIFVVAFALLFLAVKLLSWRMPAENEPGPGGRGGDVLPKSALIDGLGATGGSKGESRA